MADLKDRLQDALGDVYRVERELTGGGMSRLFLATEASLGRQVVLKLLPPDMASEVSVARFQREIQLAAQLQHPHILPILAAGARDGMLYYVMPYVPGESLRRRLAAAGRLDVDEAVRILREIADALAYAHSHGIVHRDIKPENILLEGEHAVLTDFGVARALLESASTGTLTSTGVSIGTPAYMAPEQIAGEREIDARADLYALAVVGYEMLTGVRPFTGSSAQAVLAAQMTEPAIPVKQQRPDVPPPVSEALDRALAKEPNARFATMGEFLTALGAARGTGVGFAGVRRRSLAIAAVVAALLVMVAGVLVIRGTNGGDVGDPRRSLIVFPFRNLTGDADRDWLEAGAANMLGLNLGHWRELTVYDDERTRALLRQARVEDPAALDVEQARGLARRANAGTLVIGDIRRQRDTLVIEAKLHDVRTGTRVATEVVRVGPAADPRSAFDTLAARILRVGRLPPGEHPGAVAQTTRSLDAYREYLAGMDALQGFHLDSAQGLFNRAIELDSTFALAYLRLTQALAWNRTPAPVAQRLELARKAERFGIALPLRLRTLVQIELARLEGAYPRARQLARTLIARDSSDAEAWYQLGEAEFHHDAWAIPHADSLGNLGRALRAFERALALDSGYHLAYRHVIDLMLICSESTLFLCGPDSALYAPSMERTMVDLVGADSVRVMRAQMRQAMGPAIRSWVAAVPMSQSPQEVYLAWLIEEHRFTDAERQLERFRALQPDSLARAPYVAIIDLGSGRHAAAARAAAPLLAVARDSARATRYQGPWGMDFRYGLLTWFSAAGRLREAHEAGEILIGSELGIPECLPIPDGRCIRMSPELLRRALHYRIQQLFTTDPAAARSALREAIAAGRRDSLRHLAFVSTNARNGIAYRLTRDTTLLSEWLRASRDTLFLSAYVTLLLARGDSAQARRLIERHAGLDQAIPQLGVSHREEVLIERYAWADVLAALGDRRRALDLYAQLDTSRHEVRWPTPSQMLRVMSFAERALLHEQLGEREQAIELYDAFTEAWQDADPELQPLVRRARAAAARLRGTSGEDVPAS